MQGTPVITAQYHPPAVPMENQMGIIAEIFASADATYSDAEMPIFAKIGRWTGPSR